MCSLALALRSRRARSEFKCPKPEKGKPPERVGRNATALSPRGSGYRGIGQQGRQAHHRSSRNSAVPSAIGRRREDPLRDTPMLQLDPPGRGPRGPDGRRPRSRRPAHSDLDRQRRQRVRLPNRAAPQSGGLVLRDHDPRPERHELCGHHRGRWTGYCYRLRAYNAAGNSGYSNEACGTAATLPSVVLTVVKVGTGTVTSTSPATPSTAAPTAPRPSPAAPRSPSVPPPAPASPSPAGAAAAARGTGTCTLTLTQNTTVTATFAPAPPGP